MENDFSFNDRDDLKLNLFKHYIPFIVASGDFG